MKCKNDCGVFEKIISIVLTVFLAAAVFACAYSLVQSSKIFAISQCRFTDAYSKTLEAIKEAVGTKPNGSKEGEIQLNENEAGDTQSTSITNNNNNQAVSVYVNGAEVKVKESNEGDTQGIQTMTPI